MLKMPSPKALKQKYTRFSAAACKVTRTVGFSVKIKNLFLQAILLRVHYALIYPT